VLGIDGERRFSLWFQGKPGEKRKKEQPVIPVFITEKRNPNYAQCHDSPHAYSYGIHSGTGVSQETAA
jgi:hypothetical protein